MKRGVLLLGLCATQLWSACTSDKSGVTKVVVTRVSDAGVACANGGVVIESGLDANGNGVLDAAEVTQTNPVCNGAPGMGSNGTNGSSGHSALVTSTALAIGDLHCPSGGTQITVGLDDGSGGGTADDGTLQPGEIDSTQYLCGGETYYPGDTTVPASPVGTSTIVTRGGNATNGNGGQGGEFSINVEEGTLGGNVKVFSTGTVDAGFTMPTATFSPGATPFVVTADTQLKSYPSIDGGIASTDVYFQVTGNDTIFKNVGGIGLPVTSIDVNAGATLTLTLNFLAVGTQVRVANDVRNAGTITTGLRNDGVSRGNIDLTASTYIGVAGSAIALDGTSATTGEGGNGGSLYVRCLGNFYNEGAIHTNGGNGESGGTAGWIEIDLENRGGIYNTGAIDAVGGTGSMQGGGRGGAIELSSGYRSLHNAGAITSRGGSGVTVGGAGDTIDLLVKNIGNLRNSGALTSRGGACSATNCDGGAGARVQVNGFGSEVRHNATIDTRGADGQGTGSGGRGGGIAMGSFGGHFNYADNVQIPPGDLLVAGSLFTQGGSGASAGQGGDIAVETDPSGDPRGQEMAFYGYTEIDTSGGSAASGTNTGGAGGRISLRFDEPSYPSGSDRSSPAGGVYNYANLKSLGGAGPVGGRGGDVQLMTQIQFSFGNPHEIVENHGAIDTSGGASSGSSATGGAPGAIALLGVEGVRNSGALTANGGNATGSKGHGSSANEIYLGSDHGKLINSGAVTATGGAGPGADGIGGTGAFFYGYGNGVENSGNINLAGGNGASDGGVGGTIDLFSSPDGPTVNTGTFVVSGGTGVTAGANGTVTIDGALVSL